MDRAKIRPGLIYFLLGAVSLLAQVILIRRLLAVFYGNELTIGAFFAGWLFWTGAGSLVFRRGADWSAKPETALANLLLIAAIIFVLTAGSSWLVDAWPRSPAGMPGLDRIVEIGFLITAPVCVLLGAAFNYSSRLLEANENNLVRLYLWEALGAAAAGIAFSLGLAGRIPVFSLIVLTGFLIALAGALALPRRKRIPALAGAIIISGLLLVFAGKIERGLVQLRWPGQEILAARESKYAEITVTRSAGQVNFWLDGLPAFSYPNPEVFEQAVHIPLSMCAKPEKVLLIGGGLLPAMQEIFKHPVRELTYLQIDPALTEMETAYLPGSDRIQKEPRLRIVYQDARIFLSRSTERFDAIIVNLPDPETANLNRYYTTDFFRLVAKRLAPAGVLGFGLGVSGNYFSDAEAALLAEGMVSLRPVFPKIALAPLGRNYLVAGGEAAAITEDPEEMVARLKAAGVSTRFVREYYLRDNLSPERLAAIKDSLSPFLREPANTDLRPRGYYLSTLLWLEQADPGVRGLIKKFLAIGPRWLALGLIAFLVTGLILVARGRAQAFAAVSIFSLGFAGMGAELVLILGFQAAYGYVYNLIAILVAAFMAGLALGAYGYQRGQARLTAKPVSSLIMICALELLAILLCAAGVWLMLTRPVGGMVAIGLSVTLLILVAVFSGIAFPLCAHLSITNGRADIGSAAGGINAWDHLGSSLGAILTTLILVPLFGLLPGIWFFALLILAGLASALALLRAR